MSPCYHAFIIVAVLISVSLGNGSETSSLGGQRNSIGCPDSAKVRQLFSRGHFEGVLSEIESFKRFIRVSPKSCDQFIGLYFGVSKYALGDTVAGEIAWRAMLKLDPKKEIWDFQLPLFLQARFDKIKRDLWQSGAIPDPYSIDYIPATYPTLTDESNLKTLRILYHNMRLNAYSGAYDNSKKEIKNYLLQCEKNKLNPDPALLLMNGELISRYAEPQSPNLMQAMLSIETGMEADKQNPSRLIASEDLQAWGKRIAQRFMIQAKPTTGK